MAYIWQLKFELIYDLVGGLVSSWETFFWWEGGSGVCIIPVPSQGVVLYNAENGLKLNDWGICNLLKGTRLLPLLSSELMCAVELLWNTCLLPRMNSSIITDTNHSITKGLWKCVFTAVMATVNAGLWCLFDFFHFDILCFSANNNAVYQFYILLLLCHCFHPTMNVWWYLFKKVAKSCQALSATSWMAPGSTSCRGSWGSCLWQQLSLWKGYRGATLK